MAAVETAKRQPFNERAAIFSQGSALATLALMILVLAREGIDLPYFDDWRDYAASTVGTYSASFLFQPINDTLYPVGKLLDLIFLDALDGNTLIYQTVSMALVLGAILWLTWKLLFATTADPVLAAGAFVSSLLILQADSYWGRQYVAYHQTIPLICLLAIFWLVVVAQWRPAVRMTATFLLGLIAGGAYISGAFAGIAVACVFLAVGLWRRHRRDLLGIGMALGLASLITSVAQAYVIVVIQHGQTHRPDTPWATHYRSISGSSSSVRSPKPRPARGPAASVADRRVARHSPNDYRRDRNDRAPGQPESVAACHRKPTDRHCGARRSDLRLSDAHRRRAHQHAFARNDGASADLPGRLRTFPLLLDYAVLALAACGIVDTSGSAAVASRDGPNHTHGCGMCRHAIFGSGMLNYRHAFSESAAVKERGLACMQDP